MHASSLVGELGIGATRTCDLGGSKSTTEVLTDFDRVAMTFTYVATSGLPWVTTEAANRWTIETLGVGRRPTIKRVAEEITYAVEQAKPHPRKLAAMACGAATAMTPSKS